MTHGHSVRAAIVDLGVDVRMYECKAIIMSRLQETAVSDDDVMLIKCNECRLQLLLQPLQWQQGRALINTRA